MSQSEATGLETDPRFPSGAWTGFWLQKELPGRHMMELHLTFQNGVLTGEGRDRVGPFIFRGRYSTADGSCYWTKRYLGKHDVFYRGFNEGKGIWGVWEIPVNYRGGFHIWPEGMADPTQPELSEEADLPIAEEEALEIIEPLALPVRSCLLLSGVMPAAIFSPPRPADRAGATPVRSE